jgi:hypothetical protein
MSESGSLGSASTASRFEFTADVTADYESVVDQRRGMGLPEPANAWGLIDLNAERGRTQQRDPDQDRGGRGIGR